jgi:hypothetical protein
MDYHFRFAPRGGGRVSIKEYRDWRSTGMAFRFEEDLGNLYIEVMFQCLFNCFLIIMEDILSVSKKKAASTQREIQLW